ncbi:HlyD family type I secretion periplasmic adaptor subunit [Rhodobacteraceae bacterium D3-12]|nr:HlyD family type I secretion periplasmic adaptor subunit [Rhodobacteraceae bacterium D3-12]
MSTQQVANYSEQEWYSEVPRRIRGFGTFGIMLMIVALGGFGYWSFTAPLAAAVVTQGSFVATGQNKIIQHLEGGIISEIVANEGEVVALGQPILLLDTTLAETRRTELQLRESRLEAMVARLRAETQEASKLAFPGHLIASAQTDKKIHEILESQRQSFDGSRQKLDNDVDLLVSNIEAQKSRIEGYTQQLAALESQIGILGKDLESHTDLQSVGLARRSEISALKRALSDGVGQTARIKAEIRESEILIEKYQKQILQTRYGYSQAALDELQSVEAELDSVREQVLQANDVLRRTKIVSPVSGTILRMHYHTAGGVIEGGRPIAEILPDGAPLIIETLIPRKEIDNVKVGQLASIRLVALNQRTTPVLTGEVYYISADAIPDTPGKADREIYIARINVPASEILRVHNFSPTPGMPAEILIKTKERTFIQYLTKPIADSMSRAFRED